MIPLAYIDSKTLLNLIGSECRPTKGEWVDVNKNLPPLGKLVYVYGLLDEYRGGGGWHSFS